MKSSSGAGRKPVSEPAKAVFSARYASLDHWRGVSALSVMLFHSFGQVRGAGLPVHPSMEWVRRISDFGGLGVDLFFVISGYCIAANLYRLAGSGAGVKDFLRDRLLRIYPVYWGACVAAIAMNALASPFNHVPIASSLPKDWAGAVANVFLLEPYMGGVPTLLLMSWSLVFEVGFYLMAALGFALWRSGINAWLLAGAGFALGIVGLLHAGDGPLYVLRRWPEFACGGAVFAALWLKALRPRRAWIALSAIPLFAMISLVAPALVEAGSMPVASGFALLLHALHSRDSAVAGARPLRALGWIGSISYSLYLTHPLGLRVIPLARRWVEHDSAWMWVLQPVGWACSVLLAWLFYKACEAPIERWRRGLRGHY
jgi:peptidoglycan/LPS O-acetylase OafA/YrhL